MGGGGIKHSGRSTAQPGGPYSTVVNAPPAIDLNVGGKA